MGIIGTTSFFPSKNLGCFGDGGALFTNDASLGEKIKMIANHGQRVKYHHEVIGINSRLDTLQAAILLVKLKHLQRYTQSRNEVADHYDQLLSPVTFLQTPQRSKNSTHVFHQYTLKVDKRDRDDFKKYLESHGVPTMIYYPVPLHLQNAYKNAIKKTGGYPVTEHLSKTVISLPIHTEMTIEDIHYIVDTIRKY
jgi:dTDP-4-amino-4,6-dideoxygalactose transaminase